MSNHIDYPWHLLKDLDHPWHVPKIPRSTLSCAQITLTNIEDTRDVWGIGKVPEKISVLSDARDVSIIEQMPGMVSMIVQMTGMVAMIVQMTGMVAMIVLDLLRYTRKSEECKPRSFRACVLSHRPSMEPAYH
jgi:hypothetical protein